MGKLSEEDILKNNELVDKLVDKIALVDNSRGSMLRYVLSDLKLEYLLAPASSREDHHCCFPGGLVQHSLNVTSNLYKITKAMAPGRWQEAELIFLGLVHDLGKCGDGENLYYVPNPSDWHRNKGMLYEVNKKCAYMPIQERSLYLLQKYGITLSAEEYLAIRLHDGAYLEENKPYMQKEPDLAILIHWADHWSCAQEKKEFGSIEISPAS
jgi:hypothetical protein